MYIYSCIYNSNYIPPHNVEGLLFPLAVIVLVVIVRFPLFGPSRENGRYRNRLPSYASQPAKPTSQPASPANPASPPTQPTQPARQPATPPPPPPRHPDAQGVGGEVFLWWNYDTNEGRFGKVQFLAFKNDLKIMILAFQSFPV